MTLTIDCPWCDSQVPLQDEDDSLACDACDVVALLAADPLEELAAAA